METKLNVDKKVSALAASAESTLNQLFTSPQLKIETWLMRLSAGDAAGEWEELTNDSGVNNQRIREKIDQSQKPVSELALAYVGIVNWRQSRQRMAYLQFYRAGQELGLLCLRRLKDDSPEGKVEPTGNLLIAGASRNIWI